MTDPLADRLAALRPDPGALSRDRLLFEAGRRSARPGRLWPCVSAALAVACAGLAVRLWTVTTPPAPEIVTLPPPVTVVQPPAPPPPEVPPPSPEVPPATASVADDEVDAVRSALRTRDAVVRWGADALPVARPTGPAAIPDDDLQPAGRFPRLTFPFFGGSP